MTTTNKLLVALALWLGIMKVGEQGGAIRVLGAMSGTERLVAELLYGTGLRVEPRIRIALVRAVSHGNRWSV